MDEKWQNPEIIEFPTVLVNAKTRKTEAEFHEYLKTKIHKKLNSYCVQVTGIQQVESNSE